MIAISHSDSVHVRVDLKIIKLKFVICVRWTWSMCYQESILYSCKIISNGQLSLISQLKPIICLHLSEPQNVTFIYRYQCFQKKSRTITRFIYIECECEKKTKRCLGRCQTHVFHLTYTDYQNDIEWTTKKIANEQRDKKNGEKKWWQRMHAIHVIQWITLDYLEMKFQSISSMLKVYLTYLVHCFA